MPTHSPTMTLGRLSNRIRQMPSFLWILEARLKGVQIQGDITFYGRPMISIARNGRIVLGRGVKVASHVRANPLGLFQPSVLRALAPNAELILGDRVGISGTVLCAGASIQVGEGTIMGAGAMVIDNDFHQPVGEWDWSNDSNLCGPLARPVRIGRGVFIGARAIVLKGVTIGDRAVVGAGAVVSKDVPAYHIAIGNPARVMPLRKNSPPDSQSNA